jgi:uncharacterized protein with HEPN domain
MLDYAQTAMRFISTRSRADLDTDEMFFLALLRAIETVGEAASRVSADTKAVYPEIPWRSIISTRNRLIHGYDQINKDTLWNIAIAELPPLIHALEKILADFDV